MATCVYCGNSTEWESTPEGYKMLNQDGSRHYCDRSKGPRFQRQSGTGRAVNVPPMQVQGFGSRVGDVPYESEVVRLSAERWEELIARLDRIEALLTQPHAEVEWQWPDGVADTRLA